MNQQSARDYIRDFAAEFNHSTGRPRVDIQSLAAFYNKWGFFIRLVTDVYIDNVSPDTQMDIYCISNTCAIKCKRYAILWIG